MRIRQLNPIRKNTRKGMHEMKKYLEYFKEIVVENREELITIGTLAQKEIYEKLKIHLTDPEVPIAMYACIFDAIRDVLKDMESKKDFFKINIANRLEVGYTSSHSSPVTEDLEKKGNYTMYLKHIENNSLTEMDALETKSVRLCTQWNAANISSSIESIKKITVKALKYLEERLSMYPGSAEVVMPIFCMIHEKMIQFLILERSAQNVFEYHINMAGCYEAYIRMMEEGVNISFKPTIYDKGKMKNDGGATAKYE